MPHVILVSVDQTRFRVDEEVAKLSTTVKTILDELEQRREDEGHETIIPVANVQGPILGLFVQWAEHHYEAGDLPPDDDMEAYRARAGDPIDPWDEQFIQENDAALVDIFICANQLDVKGLVYLIVSHRMGVLLTRLVANAMDGLVRMLGLIGGQQAPPQVLAPPDGNATAAGGNDQEEGSEAEDNEEVASSEDDDDDGGPNNRGNGDGWLDGDDDEYKEDNSSDDD